MEEESIIYELLHSKYIYAYREKLLEEDTNFTKWVRESRESLEKTLNSNDMKLVNKFITDNNMCEDYIDYQTGIKILNYGIRIGLQIQKALNDFEKTE